MGNNLGTTTKAKTISYWVVTGLVVLVFAGSGVANLVPVPHIAEAMAHLGYPAYFLTVLGTWKVLGALAIIVPGFPRLKEWAYAGMMFDVTGAAASRAALGDGVDMVLAPLFIAGLVFASWALRPEGRVLKSLRKEYSDSSQRPSRCREDFGTSSAQPSA